MISKVTGVDVDSADLLEVGELADLHSVEPDLPAEPGAAEGRLLPVVLDVAQVVLGGVDPQLAEAAFVEGLGVLGGRLEDALILVVVLEPEGVLAVAPVGRAPRGLDVASPPGLGAQGAEEGVRVEGPGTLGAVVGEGVGAPLLGPIGVQSQHDLLEAQ